MKLKIGARPGCTKTKAVARPRKRIRIKKIIFKLGKGLNFTLNADLWFCNDDPSKNPEGKKEVFFVVFLTR